MCDFRVKFKESLCPYNKTINYLVALERIMTETLIAIGNGNFGYTRKPRVGHVFLELPYRLFLFQGSYMSSPPFLFCYALGVQPVKREEDWGRSLLGCVAIRCA